MNLEEGMTIREARSLALDTLRNKYHKHEIVEPIENISGDKLFDPKNSLSEQDTWALVKAVLDKIEKKKLTQKQKLRYRLLFLTYIKSESLENCYNLFSKQEIETVKPPNVNTRKKKKKRYKKWYMSGKNWTDRTTATDCELIKCSGAFYCKKDGSSEEFRNYRDKLRKMIREVTKQ